MEWLPPKNHSLETPMNMLRKEDLSQTGLVFFGVSNLKLDDQEGGKILMVSEKDQGGVRESRTEKTLRKTCHHVRKKAHLHHKKKRMLLKILYETMEYVESCEELVSNMLHLLK